MTSPTEFYHVTNYIAYIAILRGYLVFENWSKRGLKKKLLRNKGLVERGVLLERMGDFQIVLLIFLKKSMFSLLLEFLSGKYSHLL